MTERLLHDPQYEPPCVEVIFTREELEREVLYAGGNASTDT